MIADTQRKSGGEGSVFQGVVEVFQGDAFRVSTHAEHGNRTFGRFREGKPAVFDDGDDLLEEKPKNRKFVNWLLTIIIFLLIASIAAIGFFYYKNIYLLPIDSITVDGSDSSMVVQVDSDIEEHMLSVICSDSHGNQISAPVVNGTATYLNSNGSGNSADVITFDKANTPSVNA